MHKPRLRLSLYGWGFTSAHSVGTWKFTSVLVPQVSRVCHGILKLSDFVLRNSSTLLNLSRFSAHVKRIRIEHWPVFRRSCSDEAKHVSEKLQRKPSKGRLSVHIGTHIGSFGEAPRGEVPHCPSLNTRLHRTPPLLCLPTSPLFGPVSSFF